MAVITNLIHTNLKLSMNIDKKDSIKEIISLTERQLYQDKSMSVKITPIEELAGVNKTYRCSMVTTLGPNVSTESIIIKYKPLNSFPPRTRAPLKSFPPQNNIILIIPFNILFT